MKKAILAIVLILIAGSLFSETLEQRWTRLIVGNWELKNSLYSLKIELVIGCKFEYQYRSSKLWFQGSYEIQDSKILIFVNKKFIKISNLKINSYAKWKDINFKHFKNNKEDNTEYLVFVFHIINLDKTELRVWQGNYLQYGGYWLFSGPFVLRRRDVGD